MKSSFTLGQVQLHVHHLKKMREFYEKILGLEVLQENATEVELGKNKNPLITLHHEPDLSAAGGSEAGLYHFALLFASRKELAKTIHHILETDAEFFSGSADHLVSEAFYFTDPEGNGIELYYDRDRNGWKWTEGRVQMASVYLDPEEYIERYLVLDEKDSNTSMGHIHLKVGNIDQAKKFYVDVLGFEITAELPSALFVSVGGYHHHLGLNTWESFGATERKAGLGLKSFEFILADAAEVKEIKNKLKAAQIRFSETERGLSFDDPWKNRIEVSSLAI